ncbi:MAG TPA: hypothetical protein VGF85_02565 [Opitutaceae bacterium]
MKTSTLPIATFVAAIAAFALLPVSAAAAGAAITVTGIITILAADYGRAGRRKPTAEVIPFTLAVAEPAQCRSAA